MKVYSKKISRFLLILLVLEISVLGQAFCCQTDNGFIKEHTCHISKKKSDYSKKHSVQKNKIKKHCNHCPPPCSDRSNREKDTSVKLIKNKCFCNDGSLILTDTGFIMPKSGLDEWQELAKNIREKYKNGFLNSALLYSPYRYLLTKNLSATDYIQVCTDIPLFIKNTALLI